MGFEPRWAVELDKKAIGKTVKKALSLPDIYLVNFLAKGAFNKLRNLFADGKQQP